MLKNIKNPILKNIIEWAFSILVAFLLFLIIDNFVIKSARVYGGSMEPTYMHNDRVIINRFIYFFRDPDIGDVIAFPYMADPNNHYIKRIIGIPNDTIDIIDGFIYRNGERLYDEFSNDRVFAGTVSFPVFVEDGTFFVLGDNRRISEDSRFLEVGNVRKEDIVGKISFRWFPFNRFGFVD